MPHHDDSDTTALLHTPEPAWAQATGFAPVDDQGRPAASLRPVTARAYRTDRGRGLDIRLPERFGGETAAIVGVALEAAGARLPYYGIRVDLDPEPHEPTSLHHLTLAIAAAVMTRVGYLPVRTLQDTVLTGAVARNALVSGTPAVCDAAAAAADTAGAGTVIGPAGLHTGPTGCSVQEIASLRQLHEVAQADLPSRLLTAAAGRHSLLLTGPDGPARDAALRTLLDLLPGPRQQPVRIHPGTTLAWAVGGPGRRGLLARADGRVLHLDGLRRLGWRVTEAVTGPLDQGCVVAGTAPDGARTDDARFQLVATATPCTCNGPDARCRGPRCFPTELGGQQHGNLLDRIAISSTVPPALYRPGARRLADAAALVAAADQARADRHATARWKPDRRPTLGQLIRRIPAEPQAMNLLDQSLRLGSLTHRSGRLVLQVAWTLADLRGVSRPRLAEIADAIVLHHGLAQPADTGWTRPSVADRALAGIRPVDTAVPTSRPVPAPQPAAPGPAHTAGTGRGVR